MLVLQSLYWRFINITDVIFNLTSKENNESVNIHVMCPTSFLVYFILELFMIFVRLHVWKTEQNMQVEDHVNAFMIVCACN